MDFLWVGQQNREQMSDWYAQSILLFPSYLETVGLPICEAMSVGAPVLLSDCLYARDVAKEYANARYFSGFWPLFERSGVAISASGDAALMVGPEVENLQQIVLVWKKIFCIKRILGKVQIQHIQS